MKRVCFAFFLFFLAASTSFGQSLNAFSDYLGYFYVFSNGAFTKLEHQPIRSFRVGMNQMAYNDNTGNFKVFEKGRAVKLQDAFVEIYEPSDDLLFYVMGPQLRVYDNGERKMLSASTTHYAFNDSIGMWYDDITHRLRVYYEGESMDVIDGLLEDPVRNIKAGNNIAAWIDPRDYFKAYYHGEVFELNFGDTSINYRVGRDIVAYYLPQYQTFQALYKGELIEIADFEPENFKTGNEMVAYVDNVGEFNVFYKGEIRQVSAYEPDWYKVRDDLIVYSELGHFKAFYEGNIYELELNFVPESFQFNHGSIAYLDQQGRVKVFVKGKAQVLTTELVTEFLLGVDAISYRLGNNTYKVYYQGEIYEAQ